jgi:AcrR family transcriptional regulator
VTKGERTRQRLLEAAIQRFAADGYRRTSVSDIARDP